MPRLTDQQKEENIHSIAEVLAWSQQYMRERKVNYYWGEPERAPHSRVCGGHAIMNHEVCTL